MSTGGRSGTGGTVASGGSVASGGVQEAGGTVGTGGSNSGGTKATGGTSSGDTATRGSSTGGAATGGSGRGGSSSGGATTGGSSSGGSSTGGSTTGGSGGSQGTGSSGCGIASPLKSGTFTESISGTSRKWMVDVPTGYDTNKPYRLIFVWHPLGGNGSQIVSGGFNGLKSLANNTVVFATADGLNGSNSEASGTGYWNVNGGDMKLLQTMLDKINAGLCIDQQRIFSTGFSFGGMMTYTVGFQFKNVFRAVAPCSGKTGVIPYDDNNEDPLAIMAFHGDKDTFVATALGKAFFDMYAKRNKCGAQTKAVDPSPCVQYQDCVVPSIWCEFPGQHEQWSQEPAAIWKFFSQF
jgi:polyhydroxybutyrate depolymerase